MAPFLLYKMIVAYDGTRFHGFQRQMTNANAMMDREQNRKKSQSFVPKRPHWDASTGRKKQTTATIQDCLEDAISNWTGQTVQEMALRFAGRTDKGVHARGQVIAVNLLVPVPVPVVVEATTPTTTTTTIAATNVHARALEQVVLKNWEIQNSINSRLPTDISIVEVHGPITTSTNPTTTTTTTTTTTGRIRTFDPRKNVARKQYSYALKFRRKVFVDTDGNDGTKGFTLRSLLPICQGGYPNTFRHALDDSPCLWIVPWALDDVSHMPQLCSFLQGKHDFYNFVHKHNRDIGERSHELTLDTMRYVIISETITNTTTSTTTTNGKQRGEEERHAPVVTARLVFESKGFRRCMVRNLVGFCVDVCRGLEEVADMDWNDLWKRRSGTTGSSSSSTSTGIGTEEEVASKIHAAPPFGLCLEWVKYIDDDNNDDDDGNDVDYGDDDDGV